MAESKALRRRVGGAAIGKDAARSKFDLAFEWAARAVRMGIPLRYVLVDPWLTSEGFLKNIKSFGLDAIGMLKMGNAWYHRTNRCRRLHWDGHLADLAKSFASRRGSARRRNDSIIGSEILLRKAADEKMDEGVMLRVVYVRAWHSDEILAIGSTDLSLSPERIVQLYDRRWLIEVNFKNQKQMLGLGKSRSTDLDGLGAWRTLMMCRDAIAGPLIRHGYVSRTLKKYEIAIWMGTKKFSWLTISCQGASPRCLP